MWYGIDPIVTSFLKAMMLSATDLKKSRQQLKNYPKNCFNLTVRHFSLNHAFNELTLHKVKSIWPPAVDIRGKKTESDGTDFLYSEGPQHP